MKKSLKRAALIAATGAMLVGTAFTAEAASKENGQWCQESTGWWYKLTEDGKTFLANTWYHIKDADGVVRYYYFDQNGWLMTNTSVDGYTIDENGRWTVNGQVQTAPETEDYATSIDFAKQHAASTSSSSSTSTSTTTTSSSKTGSKTSSKTGGVTNGGKGYHVTSPGNVTATQEYGSSTISGSTITNSWANFKMTLSGAKIGTDGDGTDVYIDSDTTSNLYITYYPIGKYGTASLDGFISGLYVI